jgi:hypothetical protein
MGEYINNGKIMHATRSRTVRELVNNANELNIQREDIVTILQENGYYVLIYYYC